MSNSLDQDNITNTLILTGFDIQTLKDSEFIYGLQKDIIIELESHPIIANGSIIKFIVLSSLKRIILVLQNHTQSSFLYGVIPLILQKKKYHSCKVGFSLFDYNNQISEIDTLQIPKNMKLFLISPPVSPPNGFDFSKLEEPPGNIQIYTIEEIQKLQTNFQKKQKKTIGKKDLEILLNESLNPKIPQIILNPSLNEDDKDTYHGEFIRKLTPYIKTSMPQKSVFEEIDGSEDDYT